MYNSRKQKRENRHDGTSGRIKKSGGAGKVFLGFVQGSADVGRRKGGKDRGKCIA